MKLEYKNGRFYCSLHKKGDFKGMILDVKMPVKKDNNDFDSWNIHTPIFATDTIKSLVKEIYNDFEKEYHYNNLKFLQ